MNTQTQSLPVMQVPVNTEVTATQERAWLGLALQKNILSKDLEFKELQAQSILLTVINSQSYTEIDAATAAYRKAHTDMIESRKPFTNTIEVGIVQPLMAFEKRVDPKVNENYITLTARSLSLRKKEADSAAIANQKNQEIARFKAHVENEFHKVASEYRQLLRNECTKQYEMALTEKHPGEITTIKEMLKLVAVPAVNKFQSALLSNLEMMEIYQTVPKPDYASMYSDACDGLDGMFANFESDLGNAEAAIKYNQDRLRLSQMEEQKKLAEEAAITTLIATAETVVVDAPKIKKTVTVVIVESEQWAKSVMAAFIVNLPHLGKFVRVKSWSKLTIGQMATTLGKLSSETGVTYTNIQLQEVEK